MKVLITGSSGFVGNFLVKYLTSLNIEVIGLDRVNYKFQTYEHYHFENCDITDKNRVLDIVKRHKPTHVIHLAYIMIPQHDKEFEDSVDFGGSQNIFIAANKNRSVKQFILFSSASIYGGNKYNPEWFYEENEQKPGDWVYAQNKVKSENFYNSYNKREDLKLVIFRMCTACGPSYFKGKGLVRLLKRSPVGQLVNGTDINAQFIHEDDVKNLVYKVLYDNDIEGVYNLAPDSYASTRELSPNPKFFIKVSEKMITKIFSFLWKYRIAKISPTSVSLLAYSIIISPDKIKKRYNYEFKYTTKGAFYNSVK